MCIGVCACSEDAGVRKCVCVHEYMHGYIISCGCVYEFVCICFVCTCCDCACECVSVWGIRDWGYASVLLSVQSVMYINFVLKS